MRKIVWRNRRAGSVSDKWADYFRRLRFRLVFALVLMTLGCRPTVSPGPAKVQPAPAETSVIHPRRKSLVRRIEQPGAIVALEEAHLFARVPGNVGRLLADIGQRVEPRQILAEISVPELDEESSLKLAMIRQAEADVEQSRKALAASEAGIATADAMVVEAKALFDRWESESKRVAKLAERLRLPAHQRALSDPFQAYELS